MPRVLWHLRRLVRSGIRGRRQFRRLLKSPMITADQIDFYRSQGYLAVEQVLTADEVQELRCVTDEFVERSRQLTDHDDVYDLEPDHSPQNPRLRRIKQPNEQHSAYDRTLRHPVILDIVAQLIGPGIRHQNTKLNLKSPNFGSPVQWHQDWSFYPHTNDDILAVGVAIDEMTIDNGCLLVIPGSHRGPVHDHHQDGVFVGAVTDAEFSDDQIVPITVAAGGITLHHARTLHASARNTSAHARRLLLLEMVAVDAWPLIGFGDYEQFNARILRGEPTNQPRVEIVPVRIPEPKHERGGSIYEVQTKLKRTAF